MSSLYCASSRLPSAVTHSLRASVTSAGEVNLIIAKHTYLDVLLVEESSLSLMFRQPLYGRVKLLEAFRPHGSDQDYLFILTEKLSWCVLAFNPTTRKMVTKARGNARSGARLLKEAPLGGVDPETRCIGMHAYQGTMKVVPIKASGDLGQAFDARVEELSYLDIVFLHGCARPTLCVLYEDSEQ
jgi:DNA damage-binding protein 1